MSENANKNLVKITINDKVMEVPAGAMLIAVADDADIHIPRFCYHKKLSVAANCRMCLVEVEKAPKPLPACATPVNEGMVVWTRSEKALAAQKSTMEFLLINHPLDCPICDQGGECELQDLSMAFGGSSSSFKEMKRVVVDKEIGELIATEMTRCIQCTRCVRFGEEISGVREMGATGRGDRMEIGTFVEQSLTSELSGNIIDICPVGALTAKPSRYTSRSWEMLASPGIASHDCVGSSVMQHTFKKKLVRVVAGENEKINECWISDRDRFSYQGIYADDRVKSPMIKQQGIWKKVDWSEALDAVANQLKSVSPHEVGVLGSPRATIEELYLLQKLMRAIGVNNIDHRLRQSDFNEQHTVGLYPWLGMSIAALEDQDAFLLIGSNVRKDQPMINYRIRKAVLKGAKLMSLSSREFDFNYEVEQSISSPVKMVESLAKIAKQSALADSGVVSDVAIPSGLIDLFAGLETSDKDKAFVKHLREAENAIILLGNQAIQSPSYSTLRALAAFISDNVGAKIGFLSDAANTSGAWLAGFVPHRVEAGQSLSEPGKHLGEMLNSSKKVIVLLDVEPEYDCDNPQQTRKFIEQSKCVIAITPYASGNLLSNASIILPSAAYSETSGTYVNAEGSWQSFRAASKSFADARPAWKILRVLGNKLDVVGFDYVSSKDVRDELKVACDAVSKVTNHHDVAGIYIQPDKASSDKLQRIGEVAEYSGDSLVRRATALQQSAVQKESVQLNNHEIKRLGLQQAIDENQRVHVTQGDETVSVSIMVNDSLLNGCALFFSGTEPSSLLGSAFGEIEITT